VVGADTFDRWASNCGHGELGRIVRTLKQGMHSAGFAKVSARRVRRTEVGDLDGLAVWAWVSCDIRPRSRTSELLNGLLL
jgi:hypothetical protein